MAMNKVTFPDEILVEILSRLPVKSLLRFRCVSKPFLSLITAPHFIQIHLKQSVLLNPKILYATYNDTYSIDYKTSYVPKPYDFPANDQEIIGSCNGLVCFCDKYNYMELWNPATKESVTIPYAEIEEEFVDNDHDIVVGFCFDPVRANYKVVRLVFVYRDAEHNDFQQCEVKVYTLGTKEWRRIDDSPCCLQNRHMVPQVNGALHWLSGPSIDSTKMMDSRIVAFDVGSEEFRIVPWIEAVKSEDTNLDVTLGVLKDCLSTLCWYHGETHISVWSMKEYGVKESWSKLFSIQTPVSSMDFNLSIMEFNSIEPLVLQSHGEIILKSFGELYVYDTLHSTVTVHNICDIPPECYKAHTFVETLVSIASLVHEEAN